MSMTNSLKTSLDYLFNPGSVAVIGASTTPGKWGHDVIYRLNRPSLQAGLFPVNPNVTEVMGHKAYRNLSEIPGEVDLAVIVIPPAAVLAAMQECADKGVKAAVVISAGFKETGEAGAEMEARVVQIAKSGGVRFVGPNCNGHFNTAIDLFTNNDRSTVSRGPLSLVSQSGNFGDYILGRGAARGIGFSKYVSSGNEADLSIEDYLEYLAEDEPTKVICAYVEGIKDGRRFFDLAKRISTLKPVVIMKVGRSKEGARAAMSHTGALSGVDGIHDGLFRQTGVMRVNEVDDLLDVASALIRQPMPRGRRVGIVTGGGGFGVVATDACRRYGLEVPALTEETIRTLDKYLPPRWSHSNPVDMAGSYMGSYGCIGSMLKADYIDAILAVGSVGFPMEHRTDAQDREYIAKLIGEEMNLIDGLMERMERYRKPVIVTAPASGAGKAAAISKLEEHGIYGYATPEAGAKVLSYLVKHAEYLRSI